MERPLIGKQRLEAFSDGVIAILITIMVLELKIPHGGDWAALRPVLPVFLTYLMSFVFVGIYWNNHHHMLAAVSGKNGRVGDKSIQGRCDGSLGNARAGRLASDVGQPCVEVTATRSSD